MALLVLWILFLYLRRYRRSRAIEISEMAQASRVSPLVSLISSKAAPHGSLARSASLPPPTGDMSEALVDGYGHADESDVAVEEPEILMVDYPPPSYTHVLAARQRANDGGTHSRLSVDTNADPSIQQMCRQHSCREPRTITRKFDGAHVFLDDYYSPARKIPDAAGTWAKVVPMYRMSI